MPSGWIPELLTSLGAPSTPDNEEFFAAWYQEEHGGRETGGYDEGGQYNPFDTSLPEPGSSTYNSAGVQSYATWASGEQATVQTLEEPAYASLLSAIRSGASYGDIANAENLSPWNGGSVYSPINWQAFLAPVPSWELKPGASPVSVTAAQLENFTVPGIGTIPTPNSVITHAWHDVAGVGGAITGLPGEIEAIALKLLLTGLGGAMVIFGITLTARSTRTGQTLAEEAPQLAALAAA